jgi:hypothetical protein
LCKLFLRSAKRGGVTSRPTWQQQGLQTIREENADDAHPAAPFFCAFLISRNSFLERSFDFVTDSCGGAEFLERDESEAGMRVDLTKVDVASIDARLADSPVVAPGEKALLNITVTQTDGKQLQTECAGSGKVRWKDNFSGSSGSPGMDGMNGTDGMSGSSGCTDPNNPSQGGNGGDGTNGSSGGNGGSVGTRHR